MGALWCGDAKRFGYICLTQYKIMSEYDAFADNFAHTRNNNPRKWNEIEILKPHIGRLDRVLDIGCGTARLREYLPIESLISGHYFGLDISSELLKKAQQKHPGDHFFRGDMAKNFPFGDENFDVVTGIASFHHLLNPADQESCLRECWRVLKPGGHLFLTNWKLPQKYWWQNILRGRFKNWIIPFGAEKKPRTYRNVTESDLKQICRQVGFDIKVLKTMSDERNPKILRNIVLLAHKL